jgi:ketosteroid isomerase-like protein
MMSQEEAEGFVRRLFESLNRRMRAGRLDLHADEFLDPQVEWHAAREDPDAAVHVGHEAVRRYTLQWVEMLPDLQIGVERVFPAPGDRIVAFVRITGSGGASGVAVEMEQGWVFRLREGRIARAEEYFDRDEALAAAGLAGG